MKPALVILAAGMGSRYGGLKQLDPVGPSGETLLEYSVYDALKAGFGKIVFVIRRDFETEFRQQISSKFFPEVQIEYAFQEIDDLPAGFQPSLGRKKPWGTAHAVYTARNVVNGSFAVINADDFYGRSAYDKLAGFLVKNEVKNKAAWCLIGYTLKNTLSRHGPVSRAVCKVDKEGYLLQLKEHPNIECSSSEQISSTEKLDLPPHLEDRVSMNCFGFTSDIFSLIGVEFQKFLSLNEIDPDDKAEFYLPSIMQEAIGSGIAALKVLATDEKWYGLTYKKDSDALSRQINQMVKSGQYPSPLWALPD